MRSGPVPRFTNRTSLQRCVVVVRNLLHVDLRATVARSRGKPLDVEISELEIWTLATFEDPEIGEINAIR